jgi:hypothetical protein
MFRIKAGSEITVVPAPGANAKVFQRTLTGTVLVMALFQRECFLLHASAVGVNGDAVVFSGDSGHGKSTLASSLHACGYSLLADDIAAIQVGETTHQVLPGNQEFKLWPDSVRNIGKHEHAYDRFFPDLEKRLVPVGERLQRDPLPLRSIYVLDFGETEEIERLSSRISAIELVRNTYGVTLLHDLRTADFFQQVVRLARSVPVFRLQRGRSLDRFDRFLAMVKEHLASRL